MNLGRPKGHFNQIDILGRPRGHFNQIDMLGRPQEHFCHIGGYIENPAYVSYFITTSQIEKVTNEITGFYSQDQ
jgi:hypothetical protein